MFALALGIVHMKKLEVSGHLSTGKGAGISYSDGMAWAVRR
jgi:hypothetical protein